MNTVHASRGLLLLCMTFILLTGSAAASAFDDGRKAYVKGDFEEALVFYSSAANQNSEILYQTGLVYQAMMHDTTAQQYFEKAVKLDPVHSSAWAHLAEILYRNHAYREAQSALTQSIKHGATAYNHYMMGLVLMELSQYKRAIKHLTQAYQLEPSYDQKVTYSIGVAHEKNGNEKLAEPEFKKAIALDAGSYVGIMAALAVQALHRPKPRAWHVYVSYDLTYDDNAILKPDTSSPQLKALAQGDAVHTLSLYANYNIMTHGKFQLTANGSYYRSMHQTITYINTDILSVWITPAYQSPLGLVGIDIRADTSWLDSARYMQAFSASPRLSFHLTPSQSGSIYASYQRQQFVHQVQTATAENRDTNNYAAGYSHNVSFAHQKGMIGASYGYNYANSKGANWDSSGHSVSTYLQYGFTPKLAMQLGANYSRNKYRNTHSTAQVKRTSKSVGFSASLSYKLKIVSLRLHYTHSRNKDNVSVYQYRRNTIGLGMQYQY